MMAATVTKLLFLWLLLVSSSFHAWLQNNNPRRLLRGRRQPLHSSSFVSATEEVVVVVGGGVSGLVAAHKVAADSDNNTTVIVLEAQERVGGRVQTDRTTTSFLLDVGFAVFLESYPASRQLLDYAALELRPFVPGAVLRTPPAGRMVSVADPLRQPSSLWQAVRFPVGTLRDKWNLVRLVVYVRTRSIQDLFEDDSMNTERVLHERWGFSDELIDQFFRPFLQGIYLCPLHQQNSRMFHFVFKMFAEGNVSLPSAGGMAAIPQQLLKKCSGAGVQVHTKTSVQSITKQEGDDGSFFRIVCNQGGTTFRADTVIIATEGPVAHRLLQDMLPFDDADDQKREQRTAGCAYYSFRGPPPIDEPILVLNGSGSGPINNLCFPSVVANSYAPPGFHLCSVVVLEDYLAQTNDNNSLDREIRKELSEWFPSSHVEAWKLEGIYRVQNAQPAQYCDDNTTSATFLHPRCDTYRGRPLPKGLFLCGDHVATASLQGALSSGLQAGSLVLAQSIS